MRGGSTVDVDVDVHELVAVLALERKENASESESVGARDADCSAYGCVRVKMDDGGHTHADCCEGVGKEAVAVKMKIEHYEMLVDAAVQESCILCRPPVMAMKTMAVLKKWCTVSGAGAEDFV